MEETIKVVKISPIAFACTMVKDFFAIMIFVGFYWLPRDIIKYKATKLEITNKRIIGKVGLVNKESLDSPLNKINSVKVEQGLFGSMFNYGKIIITTSSSVFVFDYIDKPNDVKTIINNQIENYEDEKMEKQAKKIASAMGDFEEAKTRKQAEEMAKRTK